MIGNVRSLCAAAFCVAYPIWLVLSSSSAVALDEDGNEMLPGLVATYRSNDGARIAIRLDPDIQFDWESSSPDLRMPAAPFEVCWQGKLFVAARARYQFHVSVLGSVRINIDERLILQETTNELNWGTSVEVQLDLGYHAIQVVFSKKAEPARIALYWESNKFGLEPVGPRWLFHQKAETEPGDFERGRELVRAYRCAACHMIPGSEPPLKAPALDSLAANIHPEWITRWLEDTHRNGSDARMPNIGLSANEARAVVAFLLSMSKRGSSTGRSAATKGRPDVGETLFRSVGCLACHTIDEHGNSGLFGGGALESIAQKRPATFFHDWLTKPESINGAHRMPTFALKRDEVDDLASFLATLRRPDRSDEPVSARTDLANELARGKGLVVEHRCAACHDIPTVGPPGDARRAIRAGSADRAEFDWNKSCLGEPDPTQHRPGFQLNAADRQAVQRFFEQLPSAVAPQSRYEMGRRLLRELNCASCHARELDHGLQPNTFGGADGLAGEAELAKLRGELEPPSLTSVGDKFHDTTLAKLIEGGAAPRRPWLKVRMPRFAHREDERDAILHFLIEHDRIPPGASGRSSAIDGQKRVSTDRQPASSGELRESLAAELDEASALAAGHKLVSSRGFGCMSCHTVGKHQPKNVAVNARGSDLLKIGDRVRHEWFLRWVRDPARIVPGMEMPAITVAARGVLSDRLDWQLESLWRSLNSSSFVVPSDRDTAQQIISLGPGSEPVVLRDVMYDCPPGSGWCARAFAIGIPNRHNVLFDLDTMSLRAWWVGDFARERTEGKTWLWEPAGLPVWSRWSGRSDVVLRHVETGEIFVPGQVSPDRLGGWHREPQGVSFHHAFLLHNQTCRVVEQIEPVARDGVVGFTRSIRLYCPSAQYEPLVLFPDMPSSARGNLLTISGPLGESTIRAEGDAAWSALAIRDASAQIAQCYSVAPRHEETAQGAVYSLKLTYGLSDSGRLSNAEVEKTPVVGRLDGVRASSPNPSEAKRHVLPVAQGFEVRRLPLSPFVMPTALSFRPDGTPVVCSLKGQVYIAKDTDGDQLEDEWVPFSDHLAAPFGVLADGDDVLVSHKPELLRLADREGRGRATSVQVIASGWGYTEDYHDWTFGPVRDSSGNLYIATASDYTHKNRPNDARKWRGRILSVLPDGTISELARGARYPTGLAMNRDDQLFFTDNQGVQNTFNEINHVVPGSRYGVPALDDPAADQDPWPERAPAIQIPHPWTRSINGICFLDAEGKWGPFEGHGIGCEYDTRGLIRFSLQKIGDTYQGACYPFTVPEDQVPPDQRLLGPICCAVSPNGELYVGGLRDSGWGGGSNVGELLRIRPTDQVPVGIREVRAWRQGFTIDFTAPVDAEAARVAANYSVSSYHRIWKGTYATPDSDRRSERIRGLQVSADRRSVAITLEAMRPGFVYDLHLGFNGPNGRALWPADAFYTLNAVPDIGPDLY